MENYWNLGRWGRIPVSMHWTVLLAAVWLLLWFRDLLSTLIGIVAFFALLIVHELGHVAALRWKKIPVESITFYGIHGEVSHGYPRSRGDDILIAWSGVLANLLVLIVAVLSWPLIARSEGYFLVGALTPVYVVFTNLNVFLIVVALLPIGPFDGRRAWQLFPWLRQKFRNRGARSPTRSHRGNGVADKVVNLTPEKRRELERRSAKAAQDIIRDLGKKK